MIAVALPSQVPKPSPDALTFWVIYDHPEDYPHGYVLRPQWATRDGVMRSDIAWYAKSPEELEGLLPFGCERVGPHPGDEPVILQVWME